MLIEKFKKEGLALSKDALRRISGGYGDLVCRVYQPGAGWSGCTTLSHAQTLYNGGWYGVTGYCCASCSNMCY